MLDVTWLDSLLVLNPLGIKGVTTQLAARAQGGQVTPSGKHEQARDDEQL